MRPRRNTLVWVGFLAAIAILVAVFRGQIYERGGRLTVIPDEADRENVIFRWEGRIGPPMQTLIAEAFDAWRGKTRTIILSLSSPGGLMAYGGEVIALLNEIKKTHRLVTLVERNSACLSMCVPIYLQGETRYAAPESRWMFHEVNRFDPVKERTLPATQGETASATHRFIDDFLRPAGVSERWLAELMGKIRAKDYWLTGRQLFDDDARVIDELI